MRLFLAGTALVMLAACAPKSPVIVAEGSLPLSGGDSLSYRLLGRGTDTVVVLHGGPALNGRYLEAALRPLAEHHLLLLYDQRGRGRSSTARQPDSLSFAQDLDDLAAVQAHFRLGPLRLVGHQWGAALATQYAIRHPGQVARIVLLSPLAHEAAFLYRLAHEANDTASLSRWNAARSAHADSLDPADYCRHFWGFQFSPAEITSPAVVARLAPLICDEPPSRLRQREGTSRRLYASLRAWNWSDSLALASMPALVVVGGGSSAWIADADQWTSRMPDARLLVLGTTALFPWLESGDTLNREIDRFLVGEWPVASVRVDTLGRIRAAS